MPPKPVIAVDKLEREHLESYALNLEELNKGQRIEIGELRSENSKLIKKIDSLDEGFGLETQNFVVFPKRWDGRPTCSQHGPMLCMDEARGMWRCPACHIGISTHDFLNYLRMEFDGVIHIQ